MHLGGRKRIAEVIEITALGDVRTQIIGTLSHGFRQRVGIAQAIVHQPKLLLLDEPISGLDPVQIVEMRELVRSLRGEHTTVLSSHILSEISETCDRLLVIRGGEIVASGSENELAFVIAHELGHYHARDHLRGLGRSLALGLVFHTAFTRDEREREPIVL